MKASRSTGVIVAVLLTGCGGGSAARATSAAPLAAFASVAPLNAQIVAATDAMPASSPATPAAPPPTWRALFASYFGPGSPGSCGRAGRCHAGDMSDPSSAYEWLAHRGYIDGTRSALVSPSNSCLRWFGGNMPPQAQPAEDATHDLQAWVAAGAPDD